MKMQRRQCKLLSPRLWQQFPNTFSNTIGLNWELRSTQGINAKCNYEKMWKRLLHLNLLKTSNYRPSAQNVSAFLSDLQLYTTSESCYVGSVKRVKCTRCLAACDSWSGDLTEARVTMTLVRAFNVDTEVWAVVVNPASTLVNVCRHTSPTSLAPTM